jgi:argininosuccinate lyase
MTGCSLHLSRLAEDFVLMASSEFGFIDIDDGYCTGSSIMPQKKNPDLFELIRGKTGHSVGLLMHLVTLTKGLPLTYNRDMQEDKQPLFLAVRQFKMCLEVLDPLMRHVSFRTEKLLQLCDEGYMDATALAEFLVRKGIPFRQAHHVVGKLVRMAEERGASLRDLRADELKSAHSFLTEDIRSILGPEAVVQHYVSQGSANPKLVRKQIEGWKVRLRDEGAMPDPRRRKRR